MIQELLNDNKKQTTPLLSSFLTSAFGYRKTGYSPSKKKRKKPPFSGD